MPLRSIIPGGMLQLGGAGVATGPCADAGSVGGGKHDSGMSENQAGGTDTRPALGPWFLTKGPRLARLRRPG